MTGRPIPPGQVGLILAITQRGYGRDRGYLPGHAPDR